MKTKAPIVVITGASGLVGTELVTHFSKQGWQVVGLVRNPNRMPQTKNVRWAAHDLSKELNESVFKNADFMVHAAYVKEDRSTPNAYDINVSGTKQLIEASRKYKLKKSLFMSSMSAQPDALSSYGKQKFEIEKLFDSKQDVVIRSGLVIGNGGLIKQIAQFIKTKHVAPLIGGGMQPLQVVAVYDLATAIEKLLLSKLHGTFTVAEPTVFTYKSFYKIVGQKLHTPLLLIPVPFFIPLLAIRTAKLLHVPLGITEDNLLGVKKLRSVDTMSDLQKIGITLDPLETILDKNSIL